MYKKILFIISCVHLLGLQLVYADLDNDAEKLRNEFLKKEWQSQQHNESYETLKKQIELGKNIDLVVVQKIDANQLQELIGLASAQATKQNNLMNNKNADARENGINFLLIVGAASFLGSMYEKDVRLLVWGAYGFSLRYLFAADNDWHQAREAQQQKEIAENNLAILQGKNNVQQ